MGNDAQGDCDDKHKPLPRIVVKIKTEDASEDGEMKVSPNPLGQAAPARRHRSLQRLPDRMWAHNWKTVLVKSSRCSSVLLS